MGSTDCMESESLAAYFCPEEPPDVEIRNTKTDSKKPINVALILSSAQVDSNVRERAAVQMNLAIASTDSS